LPGAGVEAEALAAAEEGTVAEALIRLASDQAAAALVLGTHGHGALRELTLGSTAQDVLHRAACPVVVVGAGDPSG
jgi:nucleotide-binding universal stress UspA family protein